MALIVRCRDFITDDGDCTVSLSAHNQEEVLEAAVEHAHTTHAREDTPALRESIRHRMLPGDLALLG